MLKPMRRPCEGRTRSKNRGCGKVFQPRTKSERLCPDCKNEIMHLNGVHVVQANRKKLEMMKDRAE